MKQLRTFCGGLMAGLCIGLGGLVNLMVDNKALGAALFTIGLFTICSFGFDLYTGRVCYVFDNDKAYALRLPLIWLGNLAGTGLTALFASLSRNAPALAEKAANLCSVKTGDTILSLFFLGVLCNIIIYIAVEGYKNIPHAAGKYLALIFGVMVFILAGTEHCVADMFYFWMGGAWTGRAIVCIITITLGNSVGGILLPLLRKFRNGPAAS
jgi:formate/nitrite transporter FocA (FNT family)